MIVVPFQSLASLLSSVRSKSRVQHRRTASKRKNVSRQVVIEPTTKSPKCSFRGNYFVRFRPKQKVGWASVPIQRHFKSTLLYYLLNLYAGVGWQPSPCGIPLWRAFETRRSPGELTNNLSAPITGSLDVDSVIALFTLQVPILCSFNASSWRAHKPLWTLCLWGLFNDGNRPGTWNLIWKKVCGWFFPKHIFACNLSTSYPCVDFSKSVSCRIRQEQFVHSTLTDHFSSDDHAREKIQQLEWQRVHFYNYYCLFIERKKNDAVLFAPRKKFATV